MKTRKLTALFSLLLLTSVLANAADRVFSTGKLIGVSTEEHADAKHPQTHAVFTVQYEGMVYTVRGEKVKAKSKDYAKGMIIGDPVPVSVNGEHVYLKTPDGKELKTDVIKRARADIQ